MNFAALSLCPFVALSLLPLSLCYFVSLSLCYSASLPLSSPAAPSSARARRFHRSSPTARSKSHPFNTPIR
ncbi:MAG: hypothetical protein EOM14_12320 [Clostridia bacterium]|nr:hypothetical protein [Clostridia bacterium]